MSLWRLVDRMDKHAEYYERGNDQARTGFDFSKKMIEGWYPKPLFGGELDNVTYCGRTKAR